MATSENATRDIAHWGQLALSGFEKCLAKAVDLHPRYCALFEDQLARFSVWASGIGVFAPGRASMDHRLREVREVHDAVTSLLENVTVGIQESFRALESIIDLRNEVSEDASTGTDTTLARHVQVIADEISMLYRLSNTIRRASRESQNLKAANMSSTTDGDGRDGEFIVGLYSNYIRDRFPSIRDSLRQRLASSMVLRRRRILYRRSRYGYSGIRTKTTIPQPQVPLPQNPYQAPAIPEAAQSLEPDVKLISAQSDLQSQPFTATTLSANHYKNALTPSVVSATQTIAPSLHEDLVFPPPPDEQIKSRYKVLKRERRQRQKTLLASLSRSETSPGRHDQVFEAEDKLREDPEQVQNEYYKAVPELTCPYCLYVLPSISISNEGKWKAHVISDLDAYVCLFDDCGNSEELYRHSSDWLNHMRGHTLRWRCRSKLHGLQTFSTKDQYLDHMRETHPKSLTERQLQALAERNARPFVPMFENCPMCGANEAANNLEAHIVGHLRALALKSLPPYESEVPESSVEQEDTSDVSLSRSTIKQDPERHSPLVFAEQRTDESPEQTSRQDEWSFAINSRAIESEDVENDRLVQLMLKYKRDNKESMQDTSRPTQMPSTSSKGSSSSEKVGDNSSHKHGDDMEQTKAKYLQEKLQPREDVLDFKSPQTLSREEDMPNTNEEPPEPAGSRTQKKKPTITMSGPSTIVQHRYESVDVLIRCLNRFGYQDYRINDKNRPGIQIWLPYNRILTQEEVETIHESYVMEIKRAIRSRVDEEEE